MTALTAGLQRLPKIDPNQLNLSTYLVLDKLANNDVPTRTYLGQYCQ